MSFNRNIKYAETLISVKTNITSVSRQSTAQVASIGSNDSSWADAQTNTVIPEQTRLTAHPRNHACDTAAFSHAWHMPVSTAIASMTVG